MSSKRLSLRKINEVLRLHHALGLSNREISRAVNISYGSVCNDIQRARQAERVWPIPADMDERTLSRILFPSQKPTGQRRFVDPDFSTVQQELKRKGVTRLMLWQEYRQRCPEDGYSYAQFCARYKAWLDKQYRIRCWPWVCSVIWPRSLNWFVSRVCRV